MAYSSPRTWSTGETVTSAHMNQEVRDNLLAIVPDGVDADAWSPGLAATTTGATVSVTGLQYQIGGIMHAWARFVIGVSGGSGYYYVTLPATAHATLTASTSEGSGQTIGQWTYRDNSGPDSRNGSVLLRTSDQCHFNQEPGLVSDTYPWQVQQNDVLSLHISYPVA